MILFGGQTFDGATPGNLYTLDMESMTWNLTQTVPSSQSRHSMACSVSGDNFIIWGGTLLPLQLPKFPGRAVFLQKRKKKSA